MKAAALYPYQTTEELEQAYRTATRPVERSRWHILWLKSKGKSIPELMEVTGFRRTTIKCLDQAVQRARPTGRARQAQRQFF